MKKNVSNVIAGIIIGVALIFCIGIFVYGTMNMSLFKSYYNVKAHYVRTEQTVEHYTSNYCSPNDMPCDKIDTYYYQHIYSYKVNEVNYTVTRKTTDPNDYEQEITISVDKNNPNNTKKSGEIFVVIGLMGILFNGYVLVKYILPNKKTLDEKTKKKEIKKTKTKLITIISKIVVIGIGLVVIVVSLKDIDVLINYKETTAHYVKSDEYITSGSSHKKLYTNYYSYRVGDYDYTYYDKNWKDTGKAERTIIYNINSPEENKGGAKLYHTIIWLFLMAIGISFVLTGIFLVKDYKPKTKSKKKKTSKS